MRAVPLQLLTWGTATAAISSAVCLASVNQAPVFCSVGYRATSHALGLETPDAASGSRGAAPKSAVVKGQQPA